MRAQAAALQGGLAAIGLVAAYTTWQREPDRAPGEIVIADVAKSELTSVRFDDSTPTPPKWVELSRKTEGDEDVVWIRVSPNAATKAPERELRGNPAALKLLESFTPLRASRALPKLDAAKLKELGLEAPKKKVTVHSSRMKALEFLVGTPQIGVADPYFKAEDGRVFVLGRSLVSQLESAGVQLVDRTLHGFKTTEFDGMTIAAGPEMKKKRELVQTTPENLANAKFASKKSPEKPDQQVKNWHDKLWRLFGTDVLGRGEKPVSGEPTVGLRVDYTWNKKPRGFIEIGRVQPKAGEGTTSQAPPPTEFYARTEHTAGWVKLPTTADDLLKESEKIATE